MAFGDMMTIHEAAVHARDVGPGTNEATDHVVISAIQKISNDRGAEGTKHI